MIANLNVMATYDEFTAVMNDMAVEDETLIEKAYDEYRAFQRGADEERGEGNVGTTIEVTWKKPWIVPTIEMVSYEIELGVGRGGGRKAPGPEKCPPRGASFVFES